MNDIAKKLAGLIKDWDDLQDSLMVGQFSHGVQACKEDLTKLLAEFDATPAPAGRAVTEEMVSRACAAAYDPTSWSLLGGEGRRAVETMMRAALEAAFAAAGQGDETWKHEGEQLVRYGDPVEGDDHNCDAMGCASVGPHVLEIRDVSAHALAMEAEITTLRQEVSNRNQRALDGDKSVAAFDALYAQSEKHREEAVALRSALIASVKAAGGIATSDVSNEFLCQLPGEIAGLRQKLEESEKTVQQWHNAMLKHTSVTRVGLAEVHPDDLLGVAIFGLKARIFNECDNLKSQLADTQSALFNKNKYLIEALEVTGGDRDKVMAERDDPKRQLANSNKELAKLADEGKDLRKQLDTEKADRLDSQHRHSLCIAIREGLTRENAVLVAERDTAIAAVGEAKQRLEMAKGLLRRVGTQFAGKDSFDAFIAATNEAEAFLTAEQQRGDGMGEVGK